MAKASTRVRKKVRKNVAEGIALVTEIPPGFAVRCDTYRLEQVLVNLLTKAHAHEALDLSRRAERIAALPLEVREAFVELGLDCSTWRPRVIITEDYQPKEAKKVKYLQSHGYQLRAQIAGNTVWSLPSAGG